MSDNPDGRQGPDGLNPALKTRPDASHDTSESSRPPAETASVQREEGRGWPIVWMVVAVLGALIAVWILFL
jgi:hypothetical protein